MRHIESPDINDSIRLRHEDLERFLSYWQNNPEGLADFLGKAFGYIGYRHFPSLFLSFGAAYFAHQDICGLIDYLYDHSCLPCIDSRAGKMLKKSLEIDKTNGILQIKDLSGRHDYVRIMLLRDSIDGLPYYSIRYYVQNNEKMQRYLEEHWTGNLPTFEVVLNHLGDASPKYGVDTTFWNFRKPVELLQGVIVHPDCLGFCDFKETKSVADLIVFAANLLGSR